MSNYDQITKLLNDLQSASSEKLYNYTSEDGQVFLGKFLNIDDNWLLFSYNGVVIKIPVYKCKYVHETFFNPHDKEFILNYDNVYCNGL
jgi:hypothetical protein